MLEWLLVLAVVLCSKEKKLFNLYGNKEKNDTMSVNCC